MCPAVMYLSHVVLLVLVSRETSILISIVVASLCTHTTKNKYFSFPISLSLLSFVFLIATTLIETILNPKLVLICISLVINDALLESDNFVQEHTVLYPFHSYLFLSPSAEHLLIFLLAICIFSLEQCQFNTPIFNCVISFTFVSL